MNLADTDPYPWPFDDTIDGPNLALVVAGAQHHWLEASADPTMAIAAIERVRGAVVAVGGRVIMVRHGVTAGVDNRTGRAPTALPREGTPGWELALTPDPDTLVIDARGLNAFYGSSLDADLRSENRDHLLFAGFASEVTVDTTLRGANDRGFECLVLSDACAPIDKTIGEHALSSVTMSGGIFGAIGTTSSLIASLINSLPVGAADRPPSASLIEGVPR